MNKLKNWNQDGYTIHLQNMKVREMSARKMSPNVKIGDSSLAEMITRMVKEAIDAILYTRVKEALDKEMKNRRETSTQTTL